MVFRGGRLSTCSHSNQGFMTTAYSTGPGFYAVMTKDAKNPITHDTTIPAGKVRVYVARLEAYDIDASAADGEIQFTVLPAMAQGNPRVAKALLLLGDVINGNREAIRQEASK